MCESESTNRDWITADGPLDLKAELEGRGLQTSPEQIAMLEQIAEAWVERELLPGGRNENLWDCCPNAPKCWEKLGAEEHEPTGSRGGVTLPWVGAGYPETRVLLMGLNLVRSSGLLDEVDITTKTLRKFREGEEAVWCNARRFEYRAAAMLAALLDAIEGRPLPETPPSPRELVEPLQRTARVQAIKCSPWGKGASPPSSAMKRLCLPAFMTTELSILKPRVVIVVHSEARGRLWYEAGKPAWEDNPGLTVGRAKLADQDFALIGVTHPSDRRGRWSESWDRLISYLKEHSEDLRVGATGV